ncbi:MAG: nucleotide sugar dehydrogenase [Clostridia bacterium]|nr:nucleotide sugar dehydrogenase [Clostridia bacterium]
MPLALAFAKHYDVIGFDSNAQKIKLYQSGVDPTGEAGDDTIRSTEMVFTADETRLSEAKFIIIAVPTPINHDKTPDLTAVEQASETVGRYLSQGAVVVYESTVYPGVTEDVCIPILEAQSGLRCGEDFAVGYSPERINPADKVHTLPTICKIVSGINEETCALIAAVYNTVIDAGTYSVSNIKTAEAIKVAENSQRDINIAFMNELAMVFDRMGIDTGEVIDGMNTKWNALGFRPGLVGGHCIGVDPYYFLYQADRLGYHSRIIQAGRQINDGMGQFVADAAVREMTFCGKTVRDAKVAVLGLTFKENCPDIRNTKVVDVLKRLHEYGIRPLVTDPYADAQEVELAYGVKLCALDEIRDMDCVILAVAHNTYKQAGTDGLLRLFGTGDKVLVDVKGMFSHSETEPLGIRHWRL